MTTSGPHRIRNSRPDIRAFICLFPVVFACFAGLLFPGEVPAAATGAFSDQETLVAETGLLLRPGEAAVFRWDPETRALSRLFRAADPPESDRLSEILEGYPGWAAEGLRRALLQVGTVPIRGKKLDFADLDGNGEALLVPDRTGHLSVLEPPLYITRNAAGPALPPGDAADFAFADANGDGLDDLFSMDPDGRVKFHPNRGVPGAGRWGEALPIFDASPDAIFLGASYHDAGVGTVVYSVSPTEGVDIFRCFNDANALKVEKIGSIAVEIREDASPCGAVALPLPVVNSFCAADLPLSAAEGAVDGQVPPPAAEGSSTGYIVWPPAAEDSGTALGFFIVFTDGTAERWAPVRGSEEWGLTGSSSLDLENPYPAWGDLDNDGIADLAAASKTGEIFAWKGVEKEISAGTYFTEPLFFRRDAFVRFGGMAEGWASSPALMTASVFASPVLLVADIDGRIDAYMENGRRGRISVLEGVTRFPRIAAGDLDGDGAVELLCGTLDGRLALVKHPGPCIRWESETGADRESRPGSSAAGEKQVQNSKFRPLFMKLPGEIRHAAPAIADLDGDGRPEIIIGAEDGVVRIFKRMPVPGGGSPLVQLPAPAGIDTIPFATPAAADIDGDGIVDLAVGGADGGIRFYRGLPGNLLPQADQPGAGETAVAETQLRFETMEEYAGLDLGEYLCPAFFDIDRTGRPSLFAGNAAGKVLIYELVDGTLSERGSWEFEPFQSANTLEDYYSSYKPGYFEVSAYNDSASVDKLLALLEETDLNFRDEVAFSIENLPVEALRTMLRRDEESLLLENARQIRRLVEKLDYVRIEEKGDSTTLAYILEPGVEKICPASVYYWWVVHPRILYELPSRVETSYWENPHEYYGQEWEEWLRHEPRPSIYQQTSGSVFWRNSLPYDRRYGESLFDAVVPSATFREAVDNLHDWLTWTRKDDPFMDFGYLTQDLQPLVIHSKHYGSCGEQSILTAACARTMLIPIRVVGCRGEDHQWNEFWEDGEWYHWDINNKVNKPWMSGEGMDHKAKTISAITGWRGDERLLRITTEVHNPPESGYTEAGRGYTDTGRLTVEAVDADGAPVDGALVILRSHWDNRNMPAVWGHTNTSGSVSFDVGYEPNGGYTVEVLSPWGAAGSNNLPVTEGEEYTVRYSLPGRKITAPRAKIPGGGSSSVVALLPPGTSTGVPGAADAGVSGGPIPPEGSLAVSVAEVSGKFEASAHIGIRSRPRGGYLWDEYGYGGVRTGPVEVAAAPSDVHLALLEPPVTGNGTGADPENFDFGSLLGRADWTETGETGAFPLDRELYFAAANMGTGVVSLDAKLEFAFEAPSAPPFIEIAPRARVDEPLIRGTAGDNLGLALVEASFDGGDVWRDITAEVMFEVEDSRTGDFSWFPGASGTPPAGRYSLLMRVSDRNGSSCESVPVDYEVAAAHRFDFQPIRQDDPDSPFPVSSWMFGPFRLDTSIPFLDIRTEGHTDGLDLDLFLFRDSNGDGAVSGMDEVHSKSAGPTSSERLFLDKPENGVYWIYTHGWAAPPGGGEFSLSSSESLSRGILGLRGPAGFVNDRAGVPGTGELTLFCEYTGLSAPDMEAVSLLLDGADVTHMAVFGGGRIEMPLAGLAEADREHEVSLNVIDRAGVGESVSWSFTIDRDPPFLKILKPVSGAWAGGKVRVRVRAEDRFGIKRVTCSAPGGEPSELRRVKGADDLYEGDTDLPDNLPERCSLTFEAFDRAGNSVSASRKILVIR